MLSRLHWQLASWSSGRAGNADSVDDTRPVMMDHRSTWSLLAAEWLGLL